jgi:curved DNA-binding protein
MPLQFKDYYAILKVPRTATAEEIRKSYRKLARQFHPDVNKNADAESKFKEIGEAYEVLGDPARRKRYDELGADYRNGQDFRPPPGWEGAQYGFQGRSGSMGGFRAEDLGGFSDFFETLFGGGQFREGGQFQGGGFGGQEDMHGWAPRGDDHEASLTIDLNEAFHGAHKTVSLQSAELDQHHRVQRRLRSYKVSIPPGTTEGARIRLGGQGGAGPGGGKAGDLYLRVHIAPHPGFHLNGRELEVMVPIAPWEAALGAKVPVETMDGKAFLAVPPGTQGGQRFRLKGKGLPGGQHGMAGDLMAVVQVAIPRNLTENEKRLFEELKQGSTFDPRKAI